MNAAVPDRVARRGDEGAAAGDTFVAFASHDGPRLRGRCFAPAATALCGYFPGARLGMVGDLPGGVMRQWRRWCLSPEYLLSAEGLHALYLSAVFPLVSLHMRDDEMLAESGARMMHSAHGNGRRFEVIEPSGGQRVGHLGIFKPRHRDTHWPSLLRHLRSFVT